MKCITKWHVIIIAFFVIAALAIGSLLAMDGWIVTGDPPTKAEIAERYGITEAEIDEYHQKYPKKIVLPTDVRKPRSYSLVVYVYQFANDHEFTREDFSEIPCKFMHCFGPYEKPDKPTKSIMLYIRVLSDEQFIKVIELLQQRADVYSVYSAAFAGTYQ